MHSWMKPFLPFILVCKVLFKDDFNNPFFYFSFNRLKTNQNNGEYKKRQEESSKSKTEISTLFQLVFFNEKKEI